MKKPKTLYSKDSIRLTTWLREQRERKRLSIRDLAKLLAWAPSIVGKIEQGERRLDVVEYIAYCKALGVKPETGLKAIVSKH